MEELLVKIRQKGISLWLEGDNIKYQAEKGVMTKELLSEIGQNKQAIMDFLKQASYLKHADDIMEKTADNSLYKPVSYSQQSLWFFDKMNKGNALYNISNAFLVKGKLEEETFTKAINMTAVRHESLRTVFVEDGGKPARKIIEKSDYSMNIIDLSQIDKSKQWEMRFDAIQKAAWQSFDLESGPLWKLCLIRLNAGEQMIMLTIHHVIADAWSNRIFLLEVMEQYLAIKEGRRDKLPQIEYDYSDYVHWQRKRFANELIREPLLSYWKTKLSGYETLMLPTDYDRPPVQSFSGKTETYLLPVSLGQKIQELCLKKDITMFMYLLAGFEILLSKYSGQTDIILGTVVANRAREELRTMIGFIMNTMVIREDLSGDISISKLLSNVKKTTLDAYTYQELPFDLLLEEIKPERYASRTPVFQVMYIHQSVENSLPETNGLKFEEIPIASKIAPFDIRLSTSETENGVLCTLDYSDALYKSTTIKTFLKHYEQILENMIETIDSPVQDINMISAAELKCVTEDFNQTEKPYLRNTSVHQLFEQRVVENKEKTALHLEGKEMSYGELNERANQLARFLQVRGVCANVPVGVCLERSFEMIISLLGILKAGGAYIPIDTGYPKDRVSYMIHNAGADIFLTDREHKVVLDEEGMEGICVDEIEETLRSLDDSNLDITVRQEDLAYIIYTSGSTGEPKGAMNTQIGFLNHKLWMEEEFHINKDDIFLQKTPFSFDVSVWELFLPLMTGAKLVLAKPNGQKDPMYLAKLMIEQKVTIIHFVPSMLHAFLEEPDVNRLDSLKRMLVSGEALDFNLLAKTKEKFSIPVYNVYGPAECADVSTMWECMVDYKNQMIPIGKPISNMRIYILDKHQNPVPLGITGEIYVGGIGVGKGYIHNSELTKERYLKDKFVSHDAWMYKTGDLGRFLEDGNIAYMGRSDFQVKIRGMRIELGEIEKCVQNYKGIGNSAVIVWEKDNQTKHLAVYYTENKEDEVDKILLKKELSKHLPEYMVPNYYTRLLELPLNPSGKLDRRSLPEPESIGNMKKESFSPPENEVQSKIAEIWMELLEVESVDIYDNFFEIGGHSLMLIQVYKKLKEVFQKEFSLIELFTYSTIQSIALFITEDNEKDTLDIERLDKQKEAKRRQKRLLR